MIEETNEGEHVGKRLTRAEIDSFHEHGFLAGIDVFDEEECDAFRTRVEADASLVPNFGGPGTFRISSMHLSDGDESGCWRTVHA